jgi:hypothetical protein
MFQYILHFETVYHTDSELQHETGTSELEPVQLATASVGNGSERKWMMEMNFCRKA